MFDQWAPSDDLPLRWVQEDVHRLDADDLDHEERRLHQKRKFTPSSTAFVIAHPTLLPALTRIIRERACPVRVLSPGPAPGARIRGPATGTLG